jgi:hypothetical protein
MTETRAATAAARHKVKRMRFPLRIIIPPYFQPTAFRAGWLLPIFSLSKNNPTPVVVKRNPYALTGISVLRTNSPQFYAVGAVSVGRHQVQERPQIKSWS